MYIMWLLSLMLWGYICFAFGKKWQDLSDVLMARRVAKLLETRRKVSEKSEEWDELERQVVREKKIVEEL